MEGGCTMTATFLVFVLMLPIYLGWLFCLGAPLIVLAGLLGGAVFSRLVPAFRSLMMMFAKAKSTSDAQHDEIVVNDDGSPLVDFSRHFPALPARAGERRVWGRFAVGDRLMAAQSLLPYGYQLMVTECFRNDTRQAQVQAESIRNLRLSRAFFSEKNASDETDRLNTEFQHSGRKTGGAFDVTIVDAYGDSINMGDGMANSTIRFGKRTDPRLFREAETNRKMLSDALTSAGFAGFSEEWWHWSYGDKHWSLAMKSRTGFYGDVENQDRPGDPVP
jgi:D-alanyl-D-alanine dipeptidase